MDETRTPVAPVRPDLVALLLTAAQAPPAWAARITTDARLDADLCLDETELALLAGLVRERFGPRADLAGLRAGLDLDGLIALTVGDLQRHLDGGPERVGDQAAGGPR
ncbi:hypothetical protein GXW83_13280 [Streptacidiphilus sp. PB12-B1b]|uniref:hypothetical protein n=1 Tax=Streptacidiphilus sp. PB12-B1b TaxID=2705012 RepID=UPI0015FE536A|nr:hypothetical protein [Streptacidiphilus sp. PB12-B1b]QMU76569.1 hypothetical protein GXW83_13280 [Streptacidiphilus sp. PB12-B1b]